VSRAAVLVLSLLLGLASQGCVVSDDRGGRADDAAWARYQRDYDRWRVERAAWERRHERARQRPREDWPRAQDPYAPAGYAASRAELAAVGVAEDPDWTLPEAPPVKRGLELTWAPARQVVVSEPCPPRSVYVRARRISEYQPRPAVVCAPAYPTYYRTTVCAPTYRTTVCYPAPVVRRQVVCAPTPVCAPAPVYHGRVSTGWSVSVGGGGGGVRVGWGAGFGRCR
jgi:hypothetical protein